MSAKTSIDSICREVILEKGLCPHDYVRLLSYGLSCLKELNLDSIGKVKTVILYPNEYSQAPLPCDYVDWVRIAQPYGEHSIQMGPSGKLNRTLRSVDGQYAAREAVLAWDSHHVEDWYRSNRIGGNGATGDEFMILEEQGKIQFKGGYSAGSEVTMDYIYFDKASASASVHKYAESTIKAWMEYKYLLSFPRVTPYEKQAALRAYNEQRSILDRRLSDLTPDAVRRLVYRRFSLVK